MVLSTALLQCPAVSGQLISTHPASLAVHQTYQPPRPHRARLQRSMGSHPAQRGPVRLSGLPAGGLRACLSARRHLGMARGNGSRAAGVVAAAGSSSSEGAAPVAGGLATAAATLLSGSGEREPPQSPGAALRDCSAIMDPVCSVPQVVSITVPSTLSNGCPILDICLRGLIVGASCPTCAGSEV